ncbi:hypothetical protein [Cytobacillus sp. IB215665]|nr:hypothetical protein [Cytobacillus sp. IB215665]MDX8367666.1 hypothetical protein [Cytobacillus sp. IB215665]
MEKHKRICFAVGVIVLTVSIAAKVNADKQSHFTPSPVSSGNIYESNTL